MKIITFTKVALQYGWLGNMSPYPIIYENKLWRTTEALFQALRFDDDNIRELIREQKSPMAAKMIAKKYRDQITIDPLGPIDYANMVTCINLKIEQHPILLEMLLETNDSMIIEDVTSRGSRGSNLYWGAMKNGEDWVGQNKLGEIWMSIRKLQQSLK